jgi:hypothetical protein
VPSGAGGASQVINPDGTLNETVWSASGAPTATINKYTNAAGTGAAGGTYSTTGYMRSVWDGYTLYVAVQVGDNTPDYLTAVQNSTTRFISSTIANQDCVEFDIDFFNHKTDKWEIEMGRAKVSRGGKLVGHPLGGNGTGTWADPFSEMRAREFTDRVKDWGAYEVSNGYIAWIALELWSGADPQNGMSVGMDVVISDGPASATGAAPSGLTFWSHDRTSGYRTRDMNGNLDWGAIVLTGHTAPDNSDFSNSDWMLTNPIRWAKGDPWWPGTGTSGDTAGPWLINLPDTVESSWTPASWTLLTNAIDAGKAVLTEADKWGRPHVNWAVTGQAQVKTLAQNMEAAIVTLRWADDPLGATQFDAEPLNTLPDPMRFKTDGVFPDGTAIPGLSGRKGTYVQNEADWELRSREIKALAAIYEYGPVPDAPSIHSATAQVASPIPEHWELPPWWVVNGVATKVPATLATSVSIVATYTYTGAEGASWDGTPATRIPGFTAVAGSASNTYSITFPTAAEKAAGGITGGVPVMVHFSDGGAASHKAMGIATLSVTGVASDDRNNTAWQTRSGTCRTFFPYQGRGQRYELSNEMASAWGVSRAIDALVDAGNLQVYDNGISISNISSSADFKLGDRLSNDGITWWTVGYLDAADNSVAQMGPGSIRMLYLESGAIPPTSGGNITFDRFLTFIANGQYDEVARGSATAAVTVGTPQPMGYTINDIVDSSKIGTAGFSINGKYAFVAGVYDDRVGVTIPGAAGATGPQPWRYDAKGNEYDWGKYTGWSSSYQTWQSGTELLADNVLHNPGRANEVIRRFLTHFKWYEYLRGIDANGDISHGYGERLPFDNHELVASLYPRAAILRNTQMDVADGGDGDAIGFQSSLMVYRYLIDRGWGAHDTKAGYSAVADQLVNFNYRMRTAAQINMDPHGSDAIQYQREAAYMAWYFYNNPLNAGYANHFKYDPLFNDVLVAGGSNAYDRNYGGLKVMMPWPWAGPYYSTR